MSKRKMARVLAILYFIITAPLGAVMIILADTTPAWAIATLGLVTLAITAFAVKASDKLAS